MLDREIAQGVPGGRSRLILDQAAVIAARGELVTLIELLRGDAAVDPRTVAAARLLIDSFLVAST
ncbi:MAG TPA: hypothetical protein VMU39_03690 [Solirubrobacteraceae bacterium]|nr:hypothetical protein [Solirubrobacteraceae bacterium]